MFKKLLLTVVVFFLMTAIAVAGCVISKGASVYLSTPQGAMPVKANTDVSATADETQPTAEWLKGFSQDAEEDWSDGIAVTDYNGYSVLVHKKDFKCTE